ncbi:hypothetical protein D9M72_331330 [compost metagenome]
MPEEVLYRNQGERMSRTIPFLPELVLLADDLGAFVVVRVRTAFAHGAGEVELSDSGRE